MARARRLPDPFWLRRWLAGQDQVIGPAAWDQETLLAWMEGVPTAQWRRVSRAWARRRPSMEVARDDVTAQMDAELNKLPLRWRTLLRTVPAHVRSRIHVIARQHPDADPWGVVTRFAMEGMRTRA